MDFKLQSKLLQVLQDGEFRPLGGRQSIKVNVRVIAATHRDLEALIAEEKFREDLYYRLNVLVFRMPALRERPEDIVPLFEFFLAKYSPAGVPGPGVDWELKEALLKHTWPGNVRELENLARRYLALRDSSALRQTIRVSRKATTAATLHELQPVQSAHGPVLGRVEMMKNEAEAEAILRTLETTHWNRRQAALLLGIDYKALLYKMRKLQIDSRAQSEAVSS
jgi:DNA-binding NtrC family response regulator